MQERATRKIHIFLKEFADRMKLKVLIIRYFMRVTSIQRKFKAFYASSTNRFEILLNCFKRVQSSMVIMNKQKKGKKNANAVTEK